MSKKEIWRILGLEGFSTKLQKVVQREMTSCH